MDSHVVVIGSGVSGLATAQNLTKRGYKVIVVEAADRAGGRVRYENAPLGHSLEMGAEIIHEFGLFSEFFGDKDWEMDTLITWAQGDGAARYIPNQLTCFWFGQERRLLNSVSFDEVILDETGEVSRQIPANDPLALEAKQSSRVLESLAEGEPTKIPDLIMNEWLREVHNIRNPSVIGIVESGFANTYGSTSDILNSQHVAIAQSVYENEHEHERKLKLGFSHTVIPALREGLDIRLNWQAVHIDHSDPNLVVIRNSKGAQLKANRVVVTPPCNVIVSDIQFTPELPANLTSALRSIQVFPAVKLTLFFKKRFWPKQLHGIVCSGTVFPEMWFVQRSAESFAVTAFATATHAKGIQALGLDLSIEAMKCQLNDIFGPQTKPAHQLYYNHLYYDWSKHPYIRGGYANVLTPDQVNTLQTYSDPKIFFAGDIWTKSYASLCAALSSSRPAAEKVAASLPLAKL